MQIGPQMFVAGTHGGSFDSAVEAADAKGTVARATMPSIIAAANTRVTPSFVPFMTHFEAQASPQAIRERYFRELANRRHSSKAHSAFQRDPAIV